MQNSQSGHATQSKLKTFEEDGGIDPRCYFATVADSLLGRFGERAIEIASDAIRNMRLSGDEDGRVLWEGVSAEISDRLDFGPRTASALH